MNHSTNTIIVLLTVTAAILGAILIGSYLAGPAYASTSVKQGDYIMGTVGFSSSRELVYIIDMSANKLNTYALDKQNGVVNPIEGSPIDLSKYFTEKGK